MEPALVCWERVVSGGLDARQRLSLGPLRRDINRRISSRSTPGPMGLNLNTSTSLGVVSGPQRSVLTAVISDLCCVTSTSSFLWLLDPCIRSLDIHVLY